MNDGNGGGWSGEEWPEGKSVTKDDLLRTVGGVKGERITQ